MAVMYADGPTDIGHFKVKASEIVGAREIIMRHTNQYASRCTDNGYPVGVTVEDPATNAADGGVLVAAYINPMTRFWVDIVNGTGLAADEGGSCDVYTHLGIDVDTSTTKTVEVHEVDIVNNRALVRFLFNLHFQQTGLA